jgi:hypothetical protein
MVFVFDIGLVLAGLLKWIAEHGHQEQQIETSTTAFPIVSWYNLLYIWRFCLGLCLALHEQFRVKLFYCVNGTHLANA